jgi:Lon protease-like protein
MSAEKRELPLFPLTVTLFPGGTLPLHIFEPRYRAMLQDCLAGDRRFGAVLIAEGVEVGGPAVPHEIGTIANIVVVEPLEDGRSNLMALGEERFRIEESWLTEHGYLMGRVRLLPEPVTAEEAALETTIAAAHQTLMAYVDRLSPESGSLRTELAALRDPVRLAGLSASLLPGLYTDKQRLLELDSASERLRGIHALLRRELGLLDVLARPTRARLHRDTISPN